MLSQRISKVGFFIKAFNGRQFTHTTRTNSITSVDDLRERFSQFHRPNHFEYLLRKNPNISKLKRASLLVPISLKEEQGSSGGVGCVKTYYTLTQRHSDLKHYSGQVCFIGGKRDEADESDWVTATREAYEEAGIEQSRLSLLAQLSPFLATNVGSDFFLVTPVIVFYDNSNFEPKLNRHEVESLFEVETEQFLNAKHHDTSQISIRSHEFFLHYFNARLNTGAELSIFGVTAFAAICASAALHSRAPQFAVDPKHNFDHLRINEFIEDSLLNEEVINKAAISNLKFK